MLPPRETVGMPTESIESFMKFSIFVMALLSIGEETHHFLNTWLDQELQNGAVDG